MARSVWVSELEELCMLAVMHLGAEAYGARIRGHMQDRVKRAPSISTIYVTLLRLEQQGLVKSWHSEPTPVRGGKSKRVFEVTRSGIAAVRAKHGAHLRMWEGLDALLGPGAGGANA